MANNQALVQYTASDGSPVKLSPSIVAKYIVTGDNSVSDKDIFAFMTKCQARKLNPIAGDAYMTCFGGKPTVVVSKDYFTRTADQQPTFDGLEAGVVVINKNGELIRREGCLVGSSTERLIGGWAKVYDKRRSHPSVQEVSLAEYNTGRALWKSKPATMIRKVALVQALREAYPGAYDGIYDADEMPEPDTAEVPQVSVEPTVEAVVEGEQGSAEQTSQPTAEAVQDAQPGTIDNWSSVTDTDNEVVDADLYETDVVCYPFS